MQALIQDIRYAFRSLRKAPGFTFVAVLTLGLGIGANTTMFSVVNGVLLKPLPYEQPDRLVNIWVDLGVGNQSLPAVHPGDFRDYQQRTTLFEDFAAASGGTFRTGAGILTGDGKPEQVDVSVVTANFFPLLGVKPALGKYFDEDDELIGGADVAVITHRLWSRRFGSDPSIVGSTVTMDGVGTTIVGVLPPEFRMHLPSEAFLFRDSEMYKPLRMNWDNLPPRNFTSFTVFGRLKSGVSIEQAQDEMSRIQRELRAEYPVHEASDMRIRVIPLQDDIVKHSRRGLMILLGAVGFVLLIACANVGHLILARGMSREREFALRASVGATPGRVVRQLLTESVALATLGGVLGVGLTMWGIALLRLLSPANLPRLDSVVVDPTVLGFAGVVVLVTAILFGLYPAIQASRPHLFDSLRVGGKMTASRGQLRLRSFLIVAEVALSLVLLIGTGLMMRSFLALQEVRPGFEPENVMTFALTLPRAEYADARERSAFFQEVREALIGLPGVEQVGITSKLPLTGTGPLLPFAYDEETATNWESATADVRGVSPEYFDAVGTRLLAGRSFGYSDGGPDSSPAIIIDETLAKLAWPGEEAVGKQLQIQPNGDDEDNPYAEVIAVVEHVRMHDLTRDVRAQFYFPMTQFAPFEASIAVRSSVDPASISNMIIDQIEALDPDLPVNDVLPMEAYVRDGMAQSRFSLFIMGLFALMALALTAVGIYGVIAYSVSQRTKEIGIRMALGEGPSRIQNLVVARGLKLILTSVVVGLVSAVALSRVLSNLLFGVSATDPLTFAALSAVLIVVALAASWLPAVRATRIDPLDALRTE
ncbi:MAG: ABC transporter permease [Gemmatimonadota bacterium]